jgi:hypothetical protein
MLGMPLDLLRQAVADCHGVKLPKRPRDLNQWAKRMVDLATGAASDSASAEEKPVKNQAAVELGRRGGLS